MSKRSLDQPESGGGNRGKGVAASGAVLAVALLVLIAFGAFVWYLVARRGAPELEWARLTWLFASVEAVAFAAAGAVFGSSVQRQRAENAEAEARKNAGMAAAGRALAAVIKADDPARQGGVGVERMGPGDAVLAARHAAVAEELFP